MKKSGIAQRMQQNHRRFLRPARLNLVSLMDIFTILVFFLLVNSGDSEILHVNKQVRLPISRVVKSIHPQTRTFSAIVTIQNGAGELRPGMFAEVRLAGAVEGSGK